MNSRPIRSGSPSASLQRVGSTSFAASMTKTVSPFPSSSRARVSFDRMTPTGLPVWVSSSADAADSSGRTLGVFLACGRAVRGGDVLVAADGSLIRVIARPQPVLVVRPCAEHGSPVDLLRAAYHLGSRHVPLELQHDHLKLEPDPVLGDLLRRQHLIVSEAQAAFEP